MGRDGERKNIKIHLNLKIVLKSCVLDGRYPVLRDFVVVVLVFFSLQLLLLWVPVKLLCGLMLSS